MSAADADAFDPGEMRAIADEAARDAANKYPKAVFACEFLKPEGKQRGIYSGSFRWRVELGGFRAEANVVVRLDHVGNTGILLPTGWKTALQLPDLTSVADEAVKATGARSGISDLTCTLLGMPRNNDVVRGGIVQTAVVQHKGAAIDVLLCARINGDRWVCHRGNDAREKRQHRHTRKPRHSIEIIIFDSVVFLTSLYRIKQVSTLRHRRQPWSCRRFSVIASTKILRIC